MGGRTEEGSEWEKKVLTQRKGSIVGLPVRVIFKTFNESLAQVPHSENTI